MHKILWIKQKSIIKQNNKWKEIADDKIIKTFWNSVDDEESNKFNDLIWPKNDICFSSYFSVSNVTLTPIRFVLVIWKYLQFELQLQFAQCHARRLLFFTNCAIIFVTIYGHSQSMANDYIFCACQNNQMNQNDRTKQVGEEEMNEREK